MYIFFILTIYSSCQKLRRRGWNFRKYFVEGGGEREIYTWNGSIALHLLRNRHWKTLLTLLNSRWCQSRHGTNITDNKLLIQIHFNDSVTSVNLNQCSSAISIISMDQLHLEAKLRFNLSLFSTRWNFLRGASFSAKIVQQQS